MVTLHDYLTTPGFKELVIENVCGRPTQVFRERPRHVLDLLELSAAKPELDLLVQGTRRVSLGHFRAAVEAGAADLQKLGVGPGDPVLIVLYNSAEFLLSQWTCWRIGAVPVLGNRWWSERDLLEVIGRFRPKAVITDLSIPAAASARCEHLNVETVASWWDSPAPRKAAPDPRSECQEDDVALIEFTAGSTAVPKGVKLSHRNLVWTQQTLHVMRGARPPAPQSAREQKVALMTTPMFHNGAVVAGLSALLDGHRIVMLRGKFDAGEVLELIERERVSSWNAVPTMIARVLNHPDFSHRDVTSLTSLSTGGSMVPRQLLEHVRARMPQLAATFAIGYGMTEMSFLSIAAMGQIEGRPGAVGKPILGVEVKVDAPDETGAGELLCRSGALMIGYSGTEEQPIDADGWYHTGDQGRIDADGFLYVTGRVRDTINRGGEKVSCPRVEAAIMGHGDVREVAVVGYPDPELGERVAAVVHLRPSSAATDADMMSFVRSKLAYYEVPSRWVFRRDPLPLLPTGKIDKRTIRQQVSAEFAVQSTALAIDPEIAALLGPLAFDPDQLRRKYRLERDKRLRPDGDAQYFEVTAQFSNQVDDPHVTPGFSRPPLADEVDVIIVGGGFSGLLMAARLRQAGFARIRIVEKAGDFGGTWYWNRYPGACCDIESYVYLPLLEETGFVPKNKYSFGPEILEYCRVLGRHYELYEDACFQTQVREARWDEAAARWTVLTDRGDAMRAQFLVLSASPFDRPKLPRIPGVNDFKGYTFHTSRWDYRYTGGDCTGNMTNLADKRIGIIGTGATAIQCVPHLGASAAQLYVFERTPSSVDARNNRDTDVAWFRSLAAGWQQERMNNFVSIVNGGDEAVDLVADGWTELFRNLTGDAARRRAQKLGRALTSREKALLMEVADFKKMEQVRARVDALVSDPDVAAALKPWYRQFCKRPCFHDEYLQTFNRPNVTLVDTDGRGIEKLTEDAVVVGGKRYPVDGLIFATGFEVSSGYALRRLTTIIGKDGLKLADKWAHGLRTLHGLQTHGFPNCFVLGFTQTAFTFLVPHSLNEQAKHAAYVMQECRRRSKRIVEAGAAAEDDWVREMASKANIGKGFFASCTPGYYNSEGRLDDPFGFYASNYGGGPMKFLKILEEWRESGVLPGIELR